MAVKYATELRNARADATSTFAGSGALIRVYSGTRAADPQTAIGAQVLLATLTFSAAFAAAASGGVLTLGAIANGTGTAGAGGGTTATWFRIVKADGTTVVMDGNVGTSGADLNLNTVTIATGTTVSVTGGTITQGNA